MANIEAVIWDMDGVIVSTGLIHLKSWQDTLQQIGITFADQEFWNSFGLRNNDFIRKILGESTPVNKINEIAQVKEAMFRSRIQQGELRALPGTIELMRGCKTNGMKQAIASSAPKKNIDLILNTLDLNKFIERIVSEDDVVRGKPDPEVFLVAARRLEIPPERCVVIEDAVTGVKGAKKAGMQCIALTTTHPRKELFRADVVVHSLSELDKSMFFEVG